MSSTAMYEELDRNIDLLLGGDSSESQDATIRELLDVASELREMPDPGFRKLLAAQLGIRGEDVVIPNEAILPTLFGQGYDAYPTDRTNFLASFALHAAALALVTSSGVWLAHNAPTIRGQYIELTNSPYVLTPERTNSGGGGGGGDLDKLAASRGALPKSAREQITPPAVIVRSEDPKLKIEPTVVAPPMVNLAQANLGDPMSTLFTFSNGSGRGSGIGAGEGGGVGAGRGPGVGPGYGGGIGGGVYRVGGGVSAPRGLYTPDPEYSDEARKAKYQGTVVLWVVVGADGRPHEMRVQRSLGMGLDQKAIEAVRTWRFAPAEKEGQPVAVQINVEVNFKLY